MILLIDNYDSFTYNVGQYVSELGKTVKVVRNDQIDINGIAALNCEAIIISPGPGVPATAGISTAVIDSFAGRVPILGICLGHQAIGEVFGGRVIRAPRPIHGKVSTIFHAGTVLYQGLPQPFAAGRYHSLIVDRDSLPACLEITAQTRDGLIMGLKHKQYPVEGVQFHPESILTPGGKTLLANFLTQTAGGRQ